MTDKKCGKCENWTRTLCNEGVCIMQSVCGDCDDRENLVVTYEADKCGMPTDYYERTDSLEAAIADMLAYLDPVDAAEFRDRLESLGVEL